MANPNQTVAVVGGGLAGASAVLALARAGVATTWIEREDFWGGHAARLACKATDDCQRCNGCLAERRMREALALAGVRRLARAELRGLRPDGPGWWLSLARRPAIIDPLRCTDCGVCGEVCPQPGALIRRRLPADPVSLAVDPATCLWFTDQSAALCAEACPEEAMRFQRELETEDLPVAAVILATGYRPYDPAAKARLGHGRVPGVVTALELEEALRADDDRLWPQGPPQRVAFIQCVGSRERGGHNYCSRVCCLFALKLGRRLRHQFQSQVSIFHMDLQSFGHDFDQTLQDARRELDLVRAMPCDLMPGRERRVGLSYLPPGAPELTDAEFDLVVLSTGLTPRPENPALAQGLKDVLDQHGFWRPGMAAPGLFVAGAAGGPLNLAETAAHADQAAELALRYLREV